MIMSDSLPSSSSDLNSATSPAGLAALLATAYADIEKLHQDLALVRKRAEKAERLAASLQALNPEDASAIVFACEERATRAEQARDEAEAKKAHAVDAWSQLTQFFAALDAAAVDAGANFTRTIQDGASFTLPPMPINSRGRTFLPRPAYPTLPHATTTTTTTTTSSRRPRTPSVDGYGQQPPNKRSRPGEYLDHQSRQPPAPRMILPPGDHQKSHSSRRRGHSNQTNHRPSSRSQSRHSRSSSRSSSGSMSVDEMLLQATTGGSQSLPNGNTSEAQHHLSSQPQQQPLPASHHHTRRRSRRDERSRPITSPPHPSQSYPPIQHPLPQHYDHDPHQPPPPQQQQQSQHVRRSYTADFPGVSTIHDYHRSSPKQSGTVIIAANTGPGGEPLAQPGQAREFQTHIFAPPVTGAPVKKTKFAAGAAAAAAAAAASMPTITPTLATTSTTEGGAPAPPAATTVFPATNEQGQRICRQCGMPGRYKDGKCVEKWGPGPMGPGTVCDRCRKKMKRVERRGTLETQQQQQLQAQLQQTQAHNLPNPSALPPQLQQPPTTSQRTNSPRSSASASQQQQQQQHAPIHRTDTLPAHHPHGGPHSQFSVSSTRGEEAFTNNNGTQSSLSLSSHSSVPQSQPPQPLQQPPQQQQPQPVSHAARSSSSRAAAQRPSSRSSLRDMDDDIPTSAVPRGSISVINNNNSNNNNNSTSRSSSRNAMRSTGTGNATGGGRGTPVAGGGGESGSGVGVGSSSKKSSPLGRTAGGGANGGGNNSNNNGSRSGTVQPKRSSNSKSPGEASAMDVDADGDADAEEEEEEDADAEIEAEIEGLVGVRGGGSGDGDGEDGGGASRSRSGSGNGNGGRDGNGNGGGGSPTANGNTNSSRNGNGRGKSREQTMAVVDTHHHHQHTIPGEHDAELELLEAVDAAEANSSSSGGRAKEED